jgi:hypothetical protein
VPKVQSDGVVDPGDAAIQALLAAIAKNTHDDERREKLLDYILIIPPLTGWPPDRREKPGSPSATWFTEKEPSQPRVTGNIALTESVGNSALKDRSSTGFIAPR